MKIIIYIFDVLLFDFYRRQIFDIIAVIFIFARIKLGNSKGYV